ncbi:hypothetical protein ACH5RR_030606 [Cinchona calisaya]|uniref:CCHC-type domain-containing protein n=1 Tax=Cinchona calisaya TaxID=153742 RepID=A0ABD2YV29_9GENT
MVEELGEILQRFSLFAEELSGTDLHQGELQKGIVACQESLIGKIIGDKQANFVGVKNFATQVWGFPVNFSVIELGPNTFQFTFGLQSDMMRVLNNRPWVLDNQLLSLHKWELNIEVNDDKFKISPLWVQVRNFPLHWFSKEVGWKIGRVFYLVKDVIFSQIGGKDGKFIKLLVEIDVTKPLLIGTVVRVDGDMKWVTFKYEKLPDFCYACGIIGHSENSCPNKGQGGNDKEEPQFGSWLKANVGKINSVIRKDTAKQNEIHSSVGEKSAHQSQLNMGKDIEGQTNNSIGTELIYSCGTSQNLSDRNSEDSGPSQKVQHQQRNTDKEVTHDHDILTGESMMEKIDNGSISKYSVRSEITSDDKLMSKKIISAGDQSTQSLQEVSRNSLNSKDQKRTVRKVRILLASIRSPCADISNLMQVDGEQYKRKHVSIG